MVRPLCASLSACITRKAGGLSMRSPHSRVARAPFKREPKSGRERRAHALLWCAPSVRPFGLYHGQGWVGYPLRRARQLGWGLLQKRAEIRVRTEGTWVALVRPLCAPLRLVSRAGAGGLSVRRTHSRVGWGLFQKRAKIRVRTEGPCVALVRPLCAPLWPVSRARVGRLSVAPRPAAGVGSPSKESRNQGENREPVRCSGAPLRLSLTRKAGYPLRRTHRWVG